MKKIIYTLLLVFVVTFSVSPVMANEKNDKAVKPSELTMEQRIQLQKIINRVDEIRMMDKRQLSKVERKALKKELRELKERAGEMSRGIYLSLGAIIVIILLLILIL